MAQAKKNAGSKKSVNKTVSEDTNMDESLTKIQQAKHHDPFAVLGRQSQTLENGKEQSLVRSFLPHAEVVELKGVGEMKRIPNSDLFEYKLSAKEAKSLDSHFTL